MIDLVIRVQCEDDSDADWLKDRCTSVVEEVVRVQHEEGRLDGDVFIEAELDHPSD